MSIQEFVHSESLRSDQRVADQVLHLMLDAIRDGELGPGNTVHDHEWADALGVSRTPVREAIQRLLGIGLLEIAAARYTRLRSFTPAQAQQEAHDWALLHGAVVDSVIHSQPEGLLSALQQTHQQITAKLALTNAARASFDFFHVLREAVSNSPISLGATAAAYRLRLAEPALSHPPTSHRDLHQGILTGITHRDSEHAHRALADWVNQGHYALAV